MAKAQKFGAFGGVFVPSVLTILGVIMYLRLGWVVGNAGLLGTIGVILLAHVISVSTGLSVSSIATDKKVKAGGIYYMLSRSLGLPIGGAIGIALFVATALSIAMYIVGFAESFNNALGISSIYSSPEQQINNLRITGSITLVIVSTIALISTSLAIRTQYYILGAIALSLISVFAGGLLTDHGLEASTTFLMPGENSVPLITVFAIFFPAVTGFTAGVAMSGDLKDPKKSIPIGTMASIGVGLLIYLSLAVFLHLTIDSEVLRNDTNVLARIALLSAYGAPLLMAGIWGATLSSALGGILGGPRILQAMSLDRVTPRIFAKGVGKSNEPRNALIFAFLIAEAGVLIGELDLIAPIVTMFYLTAYGFINLTSALESWSGSEFRPTFKIPKTVSILGALATFGVMFKLDMVSMFASFIVIGGIFLYLTRKQISLGFSDVWQGVWSEVVRTALFRTSQTAPDSRSWRPNIILFSGSTERRQHLLSFGTKLVGRLGLLSNFDLVEDQTTKVIFAKREQAIKSAERSKGVFTRRYSCKDVYSGIERIAETYGFSGLEPNTILMGWARYSGTPRKFSQLINKLQQLDYSLLLMDYDQTAGFGDKQRIDIWWEGRGRHLTFALTICRFLVTSDDWQQASIRLYILADTSHVDDTMIYGAMDQLQEELRVQLDVKIINTALGQHSLYENVRTESASADLVYLELPNLEEGDEDNFFQKTDGLCRDVGTVVLYRASQEFKSVDLGLDRVVSSESESLLSGDAKEARVGISPLQLPDHPVLSEYFQSLDFQVESLIGTYFNDYLVPYANRQAQLVKNIHGFVDEYYAKIDSEGFNDEPKNRATALHQMLSQSMTAVEDFQQNQLDSLQQSLSGGIEFLVAAMDQCISSSSREVLLTFDKNELSDQQLKNLGLWVRAQSVFNSSVNYRLNFQKLVRTQLDRLMAEGVTAVYQQYNQHAEQFNVDLRRSFRRLHAAFSDLESAKMTSETFRSERLLMDQRLEELQSQSMSRAYSYHDYLINDSRVHLSAMVRETEQFRFSKIVNSGPKAAKYQEQTQQYLEDTIDIWANNQMLSFNLTHLELSLLFIDAKLKKQQSHLINEIKHPSKRIIQDTKQLLASLEQLLQQGESGKHPSLSIKHATVDLSRLRESTDRFIAESKTLVDGLTEKLVAPNLRDTTDYAEEVEAIEISPRSVVNYLLQSNLLAPLETTAIQLHSMLDKLDHTLSDVIQVVGLSLDSANEDSASDQEQYLTRVVSTLKEEIQRLQEVKLQTEKFLQKSEEEIVANVNKVSQHLNGRALISLALDFDYYLMTHRQSQVIDRFTSFSQRVKNRILTGITKLYYRKSEGIIAAKRFQSHLDDYGTWSARVSQVMAELNPDPEVLEALPFYYKQVFLRPHSVGRELWRIRSQVKSEAKLCADLYRKLRSGALLVLGQPFSGKTYLSELVAESFTDSSRVHTIDPPLEGSIDVKVFQRTIKKSLRYYGDIGSAIGHMEPDSVFIFNNLEQWWQRTENGFSVLTFLMDLINRHGKDYLFILNIDAMAFQLINTIEKIEENFYKIIRVRPFKAKDLKTIILSRHQTSRLKFTLNGVPEENMSEWKLAKLFTRFFDTSQGNIGVAMHQWIASIQKVSEEGLIEIKPPRMPDLEELSNIEKDRAVILITLLLHRRLSIDRLNEILGNHNDELDKQLEVLYRLDFIRMNNNVWEINPFLLPYLTTAFENELLI